MSVRDSEPRRLDRHIFYQRYTLNHTIELKNDLFWRPNNSYQSGP